ncbi:VOC family protein [Croceivirga sp. JEA036]|uniref:VOC family protein n=1 Tax=Croceivirga sp. JEA036 TaxID=2721162 RepID=UPI00143BC079|nr:VOC family protein [Croceivirga sp. JEA036]NJB35445.1 hypothetical protein [Croceivirga sp. JEA036]
MTRIYVLGLLLAGLFPLSAQENKPLKAFTPLLNKIWKAEGTWGNGSTFKQEMSFKIALDSNLIITETTDFLDPEQKNYGQRSHGIRKYDTKTGRLRFWEFDVEGNTTRGKVEVYNNDIVYIYDYGGTQVTDYWRYIDDYTYEFVVGILEDGKWQQTFLKTQFTTERKQFYFDFNHYAIVVQDLKKAGDFYKEVFQLKEISHPDNNPKFRWFLVKEAAQLHLIQKEAANFTKNKSIHLSLTTQQLETFVSHLKHLQISFYDWSGTKNKISIRSDGVKQIYLQDPDGYWIEVNNAP